MSKPFENSIKITPTFSPFPRCFFQILIIFKSKYCVLLFIQPYKQGEPCENCEHCNLDISLVELFLLMESFIPENILRKMNLFLSSPVNIAKASQEFQDALSVLKSY